MRKRLLTLLLAASMVAGSLTFALPAYAEEVQIADGDLLEDASGDLGEVQITDGEVLEDASGDLGEVQIADGDLLEDASVTTEEEDAPAESGVSEADVSVLDETPAPEDVPAADDVSEGGEPAAPAEGEPAEPAGEEPAAPAEGEPAEPAGDEPAAPAEGEPAEPAGEEPAGEEVPEDLPVDDADDELSDVPEGEGSLDDLEQDPFADAETVLLPMGEVMVESVEDETVKFSITWDGKVSLYNWEPWQYHKYHVYASAGKDGGNAVELAWRTCDPNDSFSREFSLLGCMPAGSWYVFIAMEEYGENDGDRVVRLHHSSAKERLTVPEKPVVVSIEDAGEDEYGTPLSEITLSAAPENYQPCITDSLSSEPVTDGFDADAVRITVEAGRTYYFRNRLKDGVNVTQWGSDTTYEVFDSRSDYTEVVVPARGAAATGLEIAEGESIHLFSGQTLQLTAVVTPEDAADKAVTWTSDNPGVASVDKKTGLVTTKKGGSAAITATLDANPSITDVFLVSVDGFKVSKFAASPATVTMNQTDRTTATLTVSVSTTHTNGMPVAWIAGSDLIEFVDASPTDGEWNFPEYSYCGAPCENGKASIHIRWHSGAGKTTVTAIAATGDRTSFTVYVDGLDSSGEGIRGYSGGKMLSGWAAYNYEESKWVLGDKALKTWGSSFPGPIYYFDPVTGYAVSDAIAGTGSTRVYIPSAGGIYCPGGEGLSVLSLFGDEYLVNGQGILQTGWQQAPDRPTKSYYDPDTCRLVKYSQVPLGKGWTWVNSDGLMLDRSGVPLTEEGFHIISDGSGEGQTATNKDGTAKTGWVYWDASGGVTTAKKAVRKSYVDPATRKIQEGPVTIGGKRYFQIPDTDDRIIVPQDACFEYYSGGMFGSYHTGRAYADKNGVIAFDKLVTLTEATKNLPSYGPGQYYFDENGLMYTGFKVIGGKLCNLTPRLIDQQEAMDVPCMAVDGPEMTDGEPLYYRNTNVKKAAAGISFYYDRDAKNMVKNRWIYNIFEGDYLYINKSGKAVTGPQVIDGTMYFFDTDTAHLLRSGDSNRGTYVTVGKKHYAVDPDGTIARNCLTTLPMRYYETMEPMMPSMYADDIAPGLIKADGSLATGLTAYGGERFIFDEYGRMLRGVISVGKKVYITYNASPLWPVYKGAQTLTDADGHPTAQIQKDGSVKQGWFTYEGEKYYFDLGYTMFLNDGQYPEVVRDGYTAFRIGGKYYGFSDDGAMQTGWYAKMRTADLADLYSLTSSSTGSEKYYYFDPKTGAAKTGWQTVPVPAARGTDLIVAESDGSIGSGSAKAKLYFKEDGSLARNEDLVIKKKLYHFGPDGQLAGEDSWTDPDRETGYQLPNGTKLTGRKAVSAEGKTYYFDPVTGAVERNVLRKAGKKWYYYDASGVETVALPALYDGNGNKATASFAKDGSVKSFLVNGVTAKDTVIVDAGGNILAILNAKGQPATGLVKATYTDPVHDYRVNVMLYLDADGGRHDFGLATDEQGLVKIGRNYHVYLNGEILTGIDGNEFIAIDNYASLSAADRRALDEYARIASRMHDCINVCLGADGIVVTGKVADIYGTTYHLNRFGIPLELSSPLFYKWGKNWYMTTWFSNPIPLLAYDSASYSYTAANVSVSGDGRLVGFMDAATGKPLNGTFLIPTGPGFMMTLKNGLPTTGTKKVTSMGVSVSVYYDAELGFMFANDD